MKIGEMNKNDFQLILSKRAKKDERDCLTV
jgi:hypothetical protein